MSKVNNQSNRAQSGGNNGHHKPTVLPFDDFPNSRQYHLNVHETYTNWGPREAFRELWQNCIDAVIMTNNVDRQQLFATREAVGEANGDAIFPTGDTEIVHKVFHQGAPEKCLAFVRYKGHDGYGTVEITNLGASLQKKDLCIGGTSKKNLKDQAGAHGEGLKLAALVLMRSGQDHDVFCQTTGCNLFFRFDKSKDLLVDAHRIKNDKNPEVAQQPKNTIIDTPGVKALGDVQFIIGQDRKARDEDGEMGKRSPVSQRAFKYWIKVALLLTVENGDESVISTASGKLLTSEDLRGNLYLKGLLLRESTMFRSASVTGHPLGFGYDFAQGKTNRERESLGNAHQESFYICDILVGALSVRPDLVGRVCDLLNSAEPRYVEGEIKARFWHVGEEETEDVANMFQKVAHMLKHYLLEGELESRWLYSSNEMDQNPSLLKIIEGMGRHPFKLTDNLWGLLALHGLVNTIEQEAQRRYIDAQTVTVPDTSFATSVNRLVRACLRACPQTTAMKVNFVNVSQIHLDIYVQHTPETEQLVKFHKRWLFMDAAIAELGIGDVAEAEAVVYTVSALFSDVLNRVPREVFLQQDSSRLPESHMKLECRRAQQRLVKYQQVEIRIVNKEDGGSPGLRLEWAVNAPRQDDKSMIEIYLHRVSTCSDLREKLYITKDVETSRPRRTTAATRWPTCLVHRTSVHQGTLCVPDLEAGEEYFSVLVTPEDPNSFVVLSSTRRVVAQPDIHPDASVSASSPSPLVAQPSVHSNALPAPPARPAPKNNKVQVPLHVRDTAEDLESISERDGSVLSSGSEHSELVGEVPAPGGSHDTEDGSLAARGATNQVGNNVAKESISRGSPLGTEAVRNLRLPRQYEWYWNSGNVPAMICITTPGEEVPEEAPTRKRPRTN